MPEHFFEGLHDCTYLAQEMMQKATDCSLVAPGVYCLVKPTLYPQRGMEICEKVSVFMQNESKHWRPLHLPRSNKNLRTISGILLLVNATNLGMSRQRQVQVWR